MEAVAFAYMWSADQYLAPGIGAWHPHIMVYTPYYVNAMPAYGTVLPTSMVPSTPLADRSCTQA